MMLGLPNLFNWFDKVNERKKSADLLNQTGVDLDLARLLVALRRYELKNQKLPEKLEALVPAFLAELPSRPEQEYRLDVMTEDVQIHFAPSARENPVSVPKGRAVVSNLGTPQIVNGRWEVDRRRVMVYIYLVSEQKK